jgi:glycosyltransferase involved in cell wall biosynthesis
MKTETERFEHPFSNQKRMLEACQEIWVPCTFSQQVLSKFGIKNVHCIPAPIEMPVNKNTEKLPIFLSLWKVQSLLLKLSNTTNRAPHSDDILPLLARTCVTEAINHNLLFLTIFNPHDTRKNMQEMIFGFLTLLQKYPTAVLIVKLVLAEQMTPLGDILHNVVRHYFDSDVTIACDRILVISGYLTEDELAALYRISDFYLCGSVAEGQNLPLLEAMSYGVVPVSTVHTAMADYLTDENSIPIKTRPFSSYRRDMAANVTGRAYSVEFASQTDIGRALLRACTLPKDKLQQMRHDARQTIARRFSPAVVAGMIRERLAKIRWLETTK